MSYRLINANDIAAIWPGVNDMPCVYADLPRGLDGGHYDMREPDELQRENAKLRELVSDFDKCLTEAARLAYIQGHMTIYDGTLLDSLHPRMRELGVEVGDGQQRDV